MSAGFLTKIEIDHETAWHAGLRDSYAWHQRIWDSFPGRPEGARDFLTRLDGIDGGFRLLMVSRIEPNRPGWCPEPAWHAKPIPDSFFDHGRFEFSLVANPTRKVKSERNAKNGRRVPITHREDFETPDGKIQPGLLTWLRRKGAQHGFTFDENRVRTIPRPRQWFLKKGHAGLHTATEFSGLLAVTEREAFRTAALHGVGPAKAFGFGLLCLAPVSAP
jgi:CRISPR system Cascade subunit CasE